MTTEFNPNAANAAPPKTSKRKRALLILAVVVVVGGISWLLWHLLVGRWHEDTDDAYVQGNVVSITPQTIGTVTSIGADDGMKVSAGQVLVQLDASDSKVAYDQAVANLANTVRQVRGLYSAVGANQADIHARQVAVDKARADVKRREGLVATGAVSSEELSHARDELASAEAALAAATENLSRNRALVDATTIENQPQVEAAAAQLRTAFLNLQRVRIVAPVSGYVAKRTVQLGQRVQPGAPLMTIVPIQTAYVNANFKEVQLKHVHVGQPVTLTSDLYGSGVKFHGRVTGIAGGTGSAFAVIPAQNATGNWIKVVQRVPVRIALDPRELAQHPLRVGLSMKADAAAR